MMAQGFENLRLGQDCLLRRVFDMQQCQYRLPQHVHNLEVELQHQPWERFLEYPLQPYRIPSLE